MLLAPFNPILCHQFQLAAMLILQRVRAVIACKAIDQWSRTILHFLKQNWHDILSHGDDLLVCGMLKQSGPWTI